ncbi:MAG: ribosomal protein S18-alanine N-acetyltransferase [Endozoicomonadaceae bacterium]|nr:ribosomal protein S18-alanine N-acetyltransferase [Endozoicomonadaceae bacterium]
MSWNDLDAVLAIECLANTHPWTMDNFNDCFKAGYYGQVMEQNGEIVAFGIFYTTGVAGKSYLMNVAVSPCHRRQGLGKQLLNRLLANAKQLNARVIFLEVRVSNRIAIDLYLETGFSEIGHRQNYYPTKKGREDALVMVMDLTFINE